MLDASIYQNKPQSFADAMAPWVQMLQAKQSIEQSRASTANLQAQTPGIEAEAALKVKAAAAQKWMSENAGQFKREDGTFDMAGLTNAAKAAGHIELAQKFALDDAKQMSDYATAKINEAKAKYADQSSKADADKASADAAGATTDTIARTWGHLSTFLKGMPPEEQAQRYMAYRQTLMQGNPTIYNDATLPEYNGKNMERIRKALESGSMTPEVQKNLELGFGSLGVSQRNVAISEKEQEERFASMGFTKAGRDPNSAESQKMQKWAKDNGFEGVDGLSAYDILRKYPGAAEGVKSVVSASIVPGAERTEQLKKATEYDTNAQYFRDTAKKATAISKDILATRVGTVVGSEWQQVIQQNPEVAGLKTAVEQYNAMYPNDPIKVTGRSIGEITASLNEAASFLEAKAKSATKVSKTQRLPSEAPKAAPGSSSAPKKGTEVTRGGVTYLFNGGNPADPKSWIKK